MTTTGDIIDGLTTRVGRAHGEIVAMVVKKALTRSGLERLASEFDAIATAIRDVLVRKQTQGGVR